MRGTSIILIIALLLTVSPYGINGSGIPDIGMFQTIPARGVGPITIYGNSQLENIASNSSWQGNGTESDPFIISGLNIDARGGPHCIEIIDTDLFVEIRNCHLYNATSAGTGDNPGSGLHLRSATRITVRNTDIRNNNIGIFAEYSDNILIEENRILDSKTRGVRLFEGFDITVSENNISDSGTDGLNVKLTRNVVARTNILQNNGEAGMRLEGPEWGTYDSNLMTGTGLIFRRINSFNSGYLVTNNTINGLPVYFYNREDLSSSDLPDSGGQIIFDNCVNGNLNGFNSSGSFNPVQAEKCNHLELKFLNISECRGDAITLMDCESVVVSDCSIEECERGIHCSNDPLNAFNQANFMDRNTIINTTESGISMENGIGNKIRENVLEGHSGAAVTILDSNNCTVSSNLITSSDEGIHFDNSQTIKVYDNALFECETGYFGENGTGYTNIYNNIFHSCPGPAVHLGPGCYMDRIFYNIFTSNNGTSDSADPSRPQVIDEQGKGRWNHPNGYGNQWSDLRTPDNDGDGIVDVKYGISTAVFDAFPLVEAPFDHISPPVDARGRSGNGYVHLAWEEPLKNMDCEMEGYRIYRDDRTGSRELLAELDPDYRSYNDTDLMNDDPYEYLICGVNRFGDGGFTDPVHGRPDGLPPCMEILYPMYGQILDTVHFETRWNCTDNTSGIRFLGIQLDEFAWVELNISESEHPFSQVEPGPHRLRIRATDNVGNSDTIEIPFIIDVDLPFLEITNPLQGCNLNGSTVNLTWESHDDTTDISGFMVRLDNDTWIDTGMDEYFVFIGLTMGDHWMEVRTTDLAGNLQVEAVGFHMDQTTPELTITEPPDGSHLDMNELMVRWDLSDTGPGPMKTVVTFDGEIVPDLAGGSKLYLTDLEEGLHEVVVEASDLAGNKAREVITFTIDTVSPGILSFEPRGDNVDLDSVIRIELSETMDWSSVMLLVDGNQVDYDINGSVVTHQPEDDLEFGRSYRIGIAGRDLAGHELQNGSWTFYTDNNCTVRIRVTDSGGDPITGASISIYSGDKFVTAGDGYAEFSTVAGDLSVTFSADGYTDRIETMTFLPGRLNEPDDIVLRSEGSEGEETDDQTGGNAGMIIAVILIVIILTVGLAAFIVIARRKGRSMEEGPGNDPFENAEALRREAAVREIDISAVESDYRDAIYTKRIGEEDEAKKRMEHYSSIVREYLR